MSALGQKRIFEVQQSVSALPATATTKAAMGLFNHLGQAGDQWLPDIID
jgi:hypothetical protein